MSTISLVIAVLATWWFVVGIVGWHASIVTGRPLHISVQACPWLGLIMALAAVLLR